MTNAAQPRPGRIHVVDDEPAARSALTELLRDEGFEVRSDGDAFKALGRLEDWSPDILLTDLKMPGMDGMELMVKARARVPDLSVVVMTAFGSVETAVAAMQDGADDFLTKPISLSHLLVVIGRVFKSRQLHAEAQRLRGLLEAQPEVPVGDLVGSSRAFRRVLEVVEQVADSRVSVLLEGEPGTGKETVAHSLHDRGGRRDAPFVTVRCGSLGEELLRTELFGEPGGTGGQMAQAAGGTLFLSEVESLPPGLQVALMDVLQDRPESDASDMRLVAASGVDLRARVDRGEFREDLFYRISVVTLRLPTLREREEDLPPLATRFLQKYSRYYRKPIDGFSERSLGVLTAFDWPGNIRQLESCIERAVVVCTGAEVEPRHLPPELMQHMRGLEKAPPIPGATMRDIERFAILSTLEHVGGSTSRAAKILGMSPRKIQYRLSEYKEEEPSGQPALAT
jgi:DNA-binding NtrC family response regulator